jgi:EAL domain-containing protein (putative c-di-GMP-specific phosphodiesterase class I)
LEGYSEIQGYFFSKPHPAREITERLLTLASLRPDIVPAAE